MDRLVALALLMLVATVTYAQGPVAPGDLKLQSDTKGIRLSWSAPSTAGNQYVIERSGPGYTLYTRIAGPISETQHVVETKGMDLCKERYTYRIRTLDSASEASAPSNIVSTSTLKLICVLPLMGTDPVQLLLPGYQQQK